jgi:hypothetical protein
MIQRNGINYFNTYWDLRAKPDEKGRGGLKERDPLITDQDLSFAELYTQATQTEDQKTGHMREYQYSSIMDYHSRFNSDIHGLGKWDDVLPAPRLDRETCQGRYALLGNNT